MKQWIVIQSGGAGAGQYRALHQQQYAALAEPKPQALAEFDSAFNAKKFARQQTAQFQYGGA